MTARKRRPARLPAALARPLSSIEAIQFGFDHLKGYIDSSDPTLSLDKLNAKSGGARLDLAEKQFDPMMGCRLTLLQPSAACLQTLADDLGVRLTLKIDYLEISVDWFPWKAHSRWLWLKFLLAHLTLKSSRQKVRRAKGTDTFYFGPRTTPGGKRRPRVLVAYPCLSKLAGPHQGRRCLHLEIRLSGAEALQSVGVFGLSDLQALDHLALWQRLVDLRRFASAEHLGAVLGGRHEAVTANALHTRARSFRSANAIDGMFVLQNALQATPRAKKALRAIDLRLIFDLAAKP